MNTRAKKGGEGATAKLNEDELEALRQALAKQEERIRNQGAALERERAEVDREREVFHRTREAENARLRNERDVILREREALNKEKEDEGARRNNDDAFSILRDEVRREMSDLRRAISERNDASFNYEFPAGQRFSGSQEPPLPSSSVADSAQPPPISLREATDSVPWFDGYNVPVSQFVRACRRAREMVPPHYERPLTILLINKLRGRAYGAVEDESCVTVTQLIDLLNGAFGSSKTIHQRRGELSTCYIKPGEHMLDYISRVKELRSSILDAERRMRGTVSDRITAEIDELTAASFCDGLPSLYRIQMSPSCSVHPFEAFAAAKALAVREELERQRRGPRRDDTARSRVATIPHPPIHRSELRRDVTIPRYPTAPFVRNRDTPPSTAAIGNNPRVAPALERPSDASPTIWCRYCKISGHEIQDCRKRQYNNARQGNPAGPSSRPDSPRVGPPPTRPVRSIQAIPEEEPESESSE
ncbi:PREDICTED: uncharacterized protein LOC108782251 [Cyphomyrmex costatus]|uniref:CCHC-type domain-containing protein n=1 Tax=Cyphomyrmex costatus TaxID=456900 RepID=A0A151I6F2_9HYME|nr:PREDICTED: uncharacterized protein LOC108782251 [Cyphomyrmex costatus]KYM93387.1 hypothetical protein ALC62_16010 [Cyphomyrmex costatus]